MQPESPDIHKVFSLVQAQTLSFLSQHLVMVGGDDWWQSCVLDKLTMSQQRRAKEQQTAGLDGLDLAALLRVLGRNWHELAGRVSLQRNGQSLVYELGDIRNQLAHAPAAGLSAEDLQRAADTAVRFLEVLGASPSDVAIARKLRDSLRRIALGADSPTLFAGAAVADEPDASSSGEDEVLQEARSTEEATVGVPLPWLQSGAQLTDEAIGVLESTTYVGIDFGTSTSVVSIVEINAESGSLEAVPVSIRQYDRQGREIDDHLVPTCLAWVDGTLLVGRGAAELKTQLTEGKDLWTSFKMLLGVDLGPQYPGSSLSEQKRGPATIERPGDAARIFFSTLRSGIEDHVSRDGKPGRIRYTVTVPASFEANQRKDLLRSISDSGIPAEDCVLFDEPNAAFLSYLVGMERAGNGSRFVDSLVGEPKKVLVFDFGAGTCDISILEVQVNDSRLTSRNLGISKFWALGGDDIDRAIAKEVLLPQLCGNGSPQETFSSREIDNLILPRLKPIAEELKVSCSKIAEDKGFKSIESFRGDSTPRYSSASARFTLQGKVWELSQPHLSLEKFASSMGPFLATGVAVTDNSLRAPGILKPIDNALEKVGLAPDELDMVLFIGGSSANPLVRHAVAEHVGRFVDCVTPRDMRSHVSQGAAINSFFVHGLGYAPIRPITSEDIYVITSNGGKDLVLAAGSPVPSADINVTEFVVDRESQDLIELPFCVGSKDKLLGVVTLEPPTSAGFKAGSRVRVSCKITADKLLTIRANVVGGRASATSILNPLANHELSDTDRVMLQAEQSLNRAILKGGGRPSAPAALSYAIAARNAGQWRKAAEMFEAVEQLDQGSDHASTIDYCYAMAKDYKRSSKWSQIAYQRSPTALTAYNHALSMLRDGNTTQFARLMEESLRHDSNYTPTLTVYGHHLIDKNDSRGIEYVTRAFEHLFRQLRAASLDDGDHPRLRRCARTLGKAKVIEELDRLPVDSGEPSSAYSEENLVSGVGDDRRTRKG